MTIEYRSKSRARLIQSACSDEMVAAAAWVSTHGPDHEADEKRTAGLIQYLMRHRHGSPFEHGSITFLVECPLFVAREVFRHRMFSFNEVSGRYARLQPQFWVPAATRGLINVGSAARPVMGGADAALHETVDHILEASYQNDWLAYERLLEAGVATEVARTVLPMGLYTSFYLTCNPRALMNFLSLRIARDNNAYDTYPQLEIQELAEKMESAWSGLMPLTHGAFEACGRVAP